MFDPYIVDENAELDKVLLQMAKKRIGFGAGAEERKIERDFDDNRYLPCFCQSSPRGIVRREPDQRR